MMVYYDVPSEMYTGNYMSRSSCSVKSQEYTHGFSPPPPLDEGGSEKFLPDFRRGEYINIIEEGGSCPKGGT